MIFRSKVDLWLVVVLLGASMAPLLVVASAFRDGAAWLPHVAVSLLMTAASLWLLTTTKYTVSDSEVLVQSGPLKWRLEVKSITSVAPSRSLISSPALSMQRLRIDYEHGHKSLLASPRDRDGFIKAVEAAQRAA